MYNTNAFYTDALCNKNKYVITRIISKRLNASKQFFIAFDEMFYYAYFF